MWPTTSNSSPSPSNTLRGTSTILGFKGKEFFAQRWCISYFCIAETKIPEKKQLKKGRICFDSLFQSVMAGRTWWSRIVHIMVDRKKRKRNRLGILYSFPKACPQYLLPPDGVLSKFPQCP
jgi:hypothetical protein